MGNGNKLSDALIKTMDCCYNPWINIALVLFPCYGTLTKFFGTISVLFYMYCA